MCNAHLSSLKKTKGCFFLGGGGGGVAQRGIMSFRGSMHAFDKSLKLVWSRAIQKSQNRGVHKEYYSTCTYSYVQWPRWLWHMTCSALFILS